jgi:predicted TIM-barrel fold metal-dependent hydrolase
VGPAYPKGQPNASRRDADEMLLFSTDYPHWQFDGDAVLPEGLSRELVRKIMIDNPRQTYLRLTE